MSGEGPEPAASDQEQSLSGSSTPNSTSTYEYSHEPYETFQDKVLSLAQNISGWDDVSLQRQRGGSYNRVVIAELTKGGESVRGIFRIPRFSDVSGPFEHEDPDEPGTIPQHDDEVQDQAAVLQFLSSRGLAAPALLAFDASAENAIAAPYVFQECSTGTPLDKVYGSMSLAEKLSIANELVRILTCAEKVTFPRSGPIVAGNREGVAKTASCLSGKEVPAFEVEVKGFSDTSPTSLAEMLSHRLEHHLEEERSFGPPNPVTEMWERLSAIHVEMLAAGVLDFPSGTTTPGMQSILYHWDLEPRNILVKQTDDGDGWFIDMVIDWDRVLAVPPVLARKPPIWLWDFSDDAGHDSIASDYDGDVDLFEPNRYDPAGGRLSAEGQQIRQRFEELFVEKTAEIYPAYSMEAYREEGYGTGRWIRRFARFAIHGASDSQDLKRFEHLDKEWSALSGCKSSTTKEDHEKQG